MTMMADGTDMGEIPFETQVMDVDQVRDQQIAAALVLRTFAERTDLPVLDWEVRSDFRASGGASGYRATLQGHVHRQMTFRGDTWHDLAEPDRVKREVVRRWATAFDAEIEVMTGGDCPRVQVTFTYAGVPVTIVSVVSREDR